MITPTDPTAGALTTYQIEMTVDSIPSGSVIVVTVPSSLTVQDHIATDKIKQKDLEIAAEVNSEFDTVLTIEAFPDDGPTSGLIVVEFGMI